MFLVGFQYLFKYIRPKLGSAVDKNDFPVYFRKISDIRQIDKFGIRFCNSPKRTVGKGTFLYRLSPDLNVYKAEERKERGCDWEVGMLLINPVLDNVCNEAVADISPDSEKRPAFEMRRKPLRHFSLASPKKETGNPMKRS